MKIGNRIKQRRLQLGLSVDELAEKLGKNRATIYRYESNDIENFPTTILEPLAKVLQTTPAYLMGWDDEKLVPDFTMKINYDEEMLIEHYRKLPDSFKKRMQNYINLLLNTYNMEQSELIATHNRTDTEKETVDIKKQDIENEDNKKI